MGSSYGRHQEPDVPEEIVRPKDWSSRRLEVQCFGVVRHASRADTIGATWNGTKAWVQSSDFEKHPLDPPLSDSGRAEANDVAERIAKFVESKPGSEIQVVVTSPYLRCVETAAAICTSLGSRTRLMVDLGLGEVYGPEIFGEEPGRIVRSSQEEHLKTMAPKSPIPVSTVGVWPNWPETLGMARRRFAERLLVYISRGAKARRNFLLISHADCVASCLALMPHGRVVEAVDYGASMLAWRTPLPALLTSPRTAKRIPEPSCLRRSPSGQRAWWGEDGEESREAEAWHRSDPEELLSLCRTAWQIETSNVTLGHQWCGQDHAMNCARAALRNSDASVQEVDRLLGLLSSERLKHGPESPKLRRKDSRLSCMSYETHLFGCSEKSLLEMDSIKANQSPALAPLQEAARDTPKNAREPRIDGVTNGMLKPIQSRILQRRRGTV
eukprot:Skav210340  [mRNA]  locus=scaffold4443:124645:127711:- [translate_table: standard]